MPTIIAADDSRAVAAVDAIRTGDLEALRRTLAEHPQMVGAALAGDTGARTLLHVATDWPGHYPNGPRTVAVLAGAGADVNARFIGTHRETPLHWAASTDDVAVLQVLLDLGADIDADGAVIGGGTAVDDAVAFAQWNAARALAARGAHLSLFNAAALGLIDRVSAHSDATGRELAAALWAACHGAQRATAEHLLARGADPQWRAPWDGTIARQAAQRNGLHDLAQRLDSRP